MKQPLQELWIVDTEEEANELIKLGWVFVRMIYKDREIKEWKGIFSQSLKTVATVNEPQFLMGRNDTVKPRQKHGIYTYSASEDVEEYAERMREKEQ